MHRAAAVVCLAGGVWVLAGPGWALLLLGVLLWAVAPRDAAPVRLDEVAARVRGLVEQARQAPRRVAAVGSMAAGAVALPSGVLLVAGLGAGVITAGVVLGGLSLLTGWNA
jgi:hypothetical protein